MDNNELKKLLYKENPPAHLQRIKKGSVHYVAFLKNGKSVDFNIPVIDMGDAEFLKTMHSKSLIRWIVCVKDTLCDDERFM